MKAVYDDFTFITEIYCDPTCNIALDLADAPLRPVRMVHKHAGRKNSVEIIHIRNLYECDTL